MASEESISDPVVLMTAGREKARLDVAEASVSDRRILLVRATLWSGDMAAPDQLTIRLGGQVVGEAMRGPQGPGRSDYVLYHDLGSAAPLEPGAQVTVGLDREGELPAVRVPLNGRLGPAAPVWFADSSWTAHPDALAALRDQCPAVLLFSDAHPQAGIAGWAPVANLANALRQGGYRTILLHYGPPEDCAGGVSAMLRHFDVVHHHTLAQPQQAWDPASPGAVPPLDRSLPGAVAAIATVSAARMVICAAPSGLGVLGKLPATLHPAALLSRDLVLAPRMIFAPVPREKAIGTLCGLLGRSTIIVEDEGQRLELLKWSLSARSAVLPLGPALVRAALQAAPAGPAEAVVAVGPIAAQATRQTVPVQAPILCLDDADPLDAVLSALAQARLAVVWADAGLAGALAWQAAAARGLPLVGLPAAPLPSGSSRPAEVAALSAMITEYLAQGITARPERRMGWDAAAFVAELGLPPARAGQECAEVSATLRRLLDARLSGLEDRRGVGLLVEPQQEGAMLLARAFAAAQGKERVFARNPSPADHGIQPLSQALAAGVHTVLVEAGSDKASDAALAERVLDCGLLPLPLTPQAAWTDRAALAGWRQARAGQTAYVGPGPGPAGVDLVLVPGAETSTPSDAVELTSPEDPRRGALITLFAANADAFWRRPPPPALGYDRLPAAAGLDLEAGLACPHPAVPMLALALHLGCARIVLPADWVELAALAPALAALQAAGVAVMPFVPGGEAAAGARK